ARRSWAATPAVCPSGQREQTVNLPAQPSQVRILAPPHGNQGPCDLLFQQVTGPLVVCLSDQPTVSRCLVFDRSVSDSVDGVWTGTRRSRRAWGLMQSPRLPRLPRAARGGCSPQVGLF